MCREVKDLKSRASADMQPRQQEERARQMQGMLEELEKQRFLISSLQQQLDQARHRDLSRQSQVCGLLSPMTM